MSRKILTVGFELASPEIKAVNFQSKLSLLDWDIVLFKPDIDDFIDYSDQYQGKPCLSDSASFKLRESCEHWRRELLQVVKAGKTVVVYLSSLTEVYIDSGKREYSGTGRNRQTTRLVDLFNNYYSIPAKLLPVRAVGSEMKLVDKGSEILASYWSEFEALSTYQILLTAEEVPECLVTRTGGRIVGAIYRDKTSAGTLLCLPDMDFYASDFYEEEESDEVWSKTGKQFSKRLVSSLVGLDKALRSSVEITPEPMWASDNKFMLATERDLNTQLFVVEEEIERVQKRKEEISESLKSAGILRALLYEKGKILEAAIIDALRQLGFTAEPFKDSESEFDVVFECGEGRLIGEAEGKDSKAINIDKLRQLSMNIHEDLKREEVVTPAKPVLFGNAYRLKALSEREDPFTKKCHSAAESSSTALVFTPDLFLSVQSLIASPNPEYAQACRKAILSSTGRVIFPAAPTAEEAESLVKIDTSPKG